MNAPPSAEDRRTQEPGLTAAVRLYIAALVLLLLSAPSALTLYLYQHQDSSHHFHAHRFHELAIGVAIAISAFVCVVTLRCYQRSGDAFQRWLLLGLLSFTLLYAPHGFLTSLSDDYPWLFILYGSVSRVVMAACFLVAMLCYGRPPVEVGRESTRRLLVRWLLLCLLLDLAVAGVAVSPLAGEPILRWSMELVAIALCAAAIGIVLLRRVGKRLMRLYAASLFLFAQSSIAFILATAWSHLWWYAHLVFAAGFGLLSYGVAVAYRNTGSFEEVYSEEELLDQLRIANANYRRSNDELANFAHMVSHDLQAPLRQLSTYVDMLRLDAEDTLSDSARECLEHIDKSATYMRKLVKGILDLSAVDKRTMQWEPVDLNVLLTEVISLFRKDLEQADAQVSCADLPIVYGDRFLLQQVFQNLLQNAIKYRRHDRLLHVAIDAEKRGKLWCITVADNGTGFDMADKDKVFRMFGRLHGEDISGSGAGLAICSKIVARLGGELDVKAQRGVGATFFVCLPAADIEGLPDTAPRVEPPDPAQTGEKILS